jgi:hypothetical protein
VQEVYSRPPKALRLTEFEVHPCKVDGSPVQKLSPRPTAVVSRRRRPARQTLCETGSTECSLLDSRCQAGKSFGTNEKATPHLTPKWGQMHQAVCASSHFPLIFSLITAARKIASTPASLNHDLTARDLISLHPRRRARDKQHGLDCGTANRYLDIDIDRDSDIDIDVLINNNIDDKRAITHSWVSASDSGGLDNGESSTWLSTKARANTDGRMESMETQPYSPPATVRQLPAHASSPILSPSPLLLPPTCSVVKATGG